ncbi:MAG: GMC family oxidoreductase [Steroidobacteraceae bacterium]
MTGADYIVIGGGSAGCVLAARLSEDPSVQVVLIEAGSTDAGRLRMRMPLAWRDTFMDPAVSWGFVSEPEPYADGRVVAAPRGKVLGGSASVNGMMYARGCAADYDDWARAGLEGWSFADVLPYFRRSESNWRGASAYHGGDGPLTVSRHVPDAFIYPRLMAAARDLGCAQLEDFHGAQAEGFAVPDFTVHRGERASTSTRFLHPVLHRRNLTVITDALAHRLLLQGSRARAVEYGAKGGVRQLHCDGEIVLAAGAFNSPQLLLLSGVGPAGGIEPHGIRVAHDLPGVGANLQEHQSIAMIYRARGAITFDSRLRADRLAVALLRWLLFRTGAVAGLPVSAQGFVRTAPALDRPDLQMLVSPVSMMARPWFPGWRSGAGHVFSAASVLLHPASRGSVSLRSGEPTVAPRIVLNLLQAPQDRAAFRRIIRFVRRYFATPAAQELVREETIPGGAVESDEALDAFVRANVRTAMHPVGSCAMGTGDDAVVDAQLRVRGIDGLRIADASVMPSIVGGNTNAPVIMIAEKAADLIRGRATSSRTPIG